MVQITDCFERALALLVSQFQAQKDNGDLTNFQKLIKILVTPMQQLENVKWQLKTERWLSTSMGVQLDEIGEIVGVEREINESDDDYRERIEFQIFINRSSGTPEDIMQALAFLTKATHVNIHDVGITAFQLETNGTRFPYPPNDLVDAIFDISPAGVDYAAIVATYDNLIPFELSGDLAEQVFLVSPNGNDLQELEVEPYNRIINVQNGAFANNTGLGGLDELDFPLETAGQLSELIQKNGNFPPVRF